MSTCFVALTALVFMTGAAPRHALAANPGFPHIAVWGFPGAWRDSTLYNRFRCAGSFQPLTDSVENRPRTITLRWLRDRRAEARPDFGGYRIWRVTNTPDSTQMVLLRRFSLNTGADLTWHFSVINPVSMQYECNSSVVHDSILTFVDPDSNGNYVKVCRRVDRFDRCLSRGDSVFRLVAPPGPHDGFRTWYAVTYEALNVQDNVNLDLFVPGPYDTSGNYAHCGTPGDSTTCPRINLNNKLANMIAAPVEPTGGPTANPIRVSVVPNPYRANETWDQLGAHEVHFINLPARATIRIFTVAGDLVTKLEHDDAVHDFERWDLKNDNGKDVASGIYLYRIDAGAFTFQNRFVVLR